MIIPSMNVHRGIVLFMYASGIYGLFTHPLDKETLLLPIPPIISYHRDQGFLLRFGFEIVKEQIFDQSMECVWLLQKLINSQVQEHFI